MRSIHAVTLKRGLAVLLLATTMLQGAPAFAQDSAGEARIRKLEAEVRALQRKVFPGGGAFQPEITAPASTAASPIPTSTPLTDLLSRMQAVEAQLARVTAQNEQAGNRIAELESKLAALTPPAVTAPASALPNNSGLAPASAVPTNGVATPGTAAAVQPAVTPPRVATRPPADRVQAVRAVERPQTGDAADDEYSYGFRLWSAKLYPEAAQQLKLYLQKYPRHARVSYARNLLGRAYLDDGDPREAAKWFLQNYQADKSGARAADSLLYLGRSMKQLGDTKRACIAVSEFAASYPVEASARLKADYDDTRKGLACS